MAESDTPALGDGPEFDPWRPIEVRWTWSLPPFRASWLWGGRTYSVARWSPAEARWRADALRDRQWVTRRRTERQEEQRARQTDAQLPWAEGDLRRRIRDLQSTLTDIRVMEYEARQAQAPELLPSLAEQRTRIEQRLRAMSADG